MKKECIAMLLAGGQGSRLYVLTGDMAKPAVPFGGKYRIIDFPLSNCTNSGIDTVGVLTQYRPLELNSYIGSGQPWDLDGSTGGVHILPPYQGAKGGTWYKGTANAIYQNLGFIDMHDPEYVVILSGDHIYKMDYSDMLARYIAQAAAEELSGGFDAVSFVPVSLRRNFERGFDQARLLAEEAANIWGVKAEAVLRKGRHTRAQSSLQDAALRKANVKGAYRVPHPERVRGRRFLLIDDVCTTGSTLSAAADALLEAGAAGVVCAVLAGGSRKRENPEELFP